MGRRNSNSRNRIGGMIFGGIFASVGIGFLILSIIPTLYEGWQMQSWQPVQAEVLASKLHRNSSSDGTTYRASGRYRYRWQGREYISDRIGIGSGSDNIGDWHQQMARKLDRARTSSRTITAWVNPDAPNEAIINRDIRWGLFAFKMIFVVVFGGAGIAVMWFMWRTTKKVAKTGSTPWLEKPEWRNNRIRSGGKAVVVFLWIFGIVWSLFMIPLWMNADKLASEGLPLSLFPFLFPLIGVAVLVQAVIKTLRWRRFGAATLMLNPFPGTPGGKVGGRVELPLDFREHTPVEVRLSCIHVYWRRSGKSNERREDIVWQDSRQLRLSPGPHGGLLEFAFAPPGNLPSSSEGSDYHKWVVNVRAKIAGPDLDHQFTIPVYASETQPSQPEQDYVLEQTATAAVSQQTYQAQALSPESLPSWLKIGYRLGGVELYLPMFRNLTMSLVLGLMGVIFGGAGLFMLQQDDVPFFFALIFTLVGGALFFGGLYSLGNSLLVHVSSRGVALVRRVFGVPLSRKVPAGQIVGMEKKIGAQSGSRAFYRVYAKTRQGKRITLADSLPSASAADYLIEQLGKQLHLKAQESAAVEIPTVAIEMAKKVQRARKWVSLIGFIIFALIFGETIFQFFDF